MTEKDYNPEQRNKKAMKKSTTSQKLKMKKGIMKDIEKGGKVSEKIAEKEEQIAEKIEKKEEKKEEKKPQKNKIKRSEALMNSYNVPVSTKKSMAICKFIKGKTIESAQKYLEEVTKERKVIPMKGEIPHRKGRIMSGRYPVNTAKHFIPLLKSLAGNATMNGIDDPIIVEAVANKAPRPYGRFGMWKRKRSHIKLIAREKKPTKLKEIKK